jgi:hypothetical protein
MTITQLAAWAMLAFGGLFSGAILVFAVERVNRGDGCPSISTWSTSDDRCTARIP